MCNGFFVGFDPTLFRLAGESK